MLAILLLILIFNHLMNYETYDKIIEFDNNFFKSINDFRSDWGIAIFKVITYFGEVYIPIVIIVGLLIFIKNKWIVLLQASSYAIAGVVTYIAKLVVARPRPTSALIKIPSTYSFPSGHTLTSIIFYIILVYLLTYNIDRDKRNAYLVFATIFALLISFSRPYLGVHYLSDILGGIILSIPLLFILINTIKYTFSKKLSGK